MSTEPRTTEPVCECGCPKRDHYFGDALGADGRMHTACRRGDGCPDYRPVTPRATDNDPATVRTVDGQLHHKGGPHYDRNGFLIEEYHLCGCQPTEPRPWPATAERASGGRRWAARFDHDGTFPHHHDADTAEPVWWQNVDNLGEKREHRHHHLTERASGGLPDRMALAAAIQKVGLPMQYVHKIMDALPERARGGLDVEALAEAIRNTYLAPSASRYMDAQNIAAEYARLTGGQDDE